MRKVTVPLDTIRAWLDDLVGVAVEIPVYVDWPELQLTEEQMLANAVALAAGEPDPYPNQSLFAIRITR